MAVLVGFHTEGWDHLILRAFLARLLQWSEEDIAPDWIDARGCGWDFVLTMVPRALKRFYGQCAQFAVVGMDNDGNLDLDQSGVPEDPARPRHWRHPGETNRRCRYCQVAETVERTRPDLNYVRCKPGAVWPILICVPVEAIEAWLLAARALLTGRPDDLRAENRPHGVRLKQQLYGIPVATREVVENVALPLVRAMTDAHLASLKEYSHSFSDFAEQVDLHLETITGARDCWAPDDRAAERQLAS